MALSLLLWGCSTKEEPTPTAPQDDVSSYVPESDPATAVNDFLAAGSDFRGSMNISANKPYWPQPVTTAAVPVRKGAATASFFDSDRHAADVGTVRLDDVELKKIEQRVRFGPKLIFYTTDPRTQPVDPVSDGSDHFWNIEGPPGKFKISATKVAADLQITAPNNKSKISTSNDLKIAWSGSSTDNIILVHITRLMPLMTVVSRPAPIDFVLLRMEDTGSYTIPAAKLRGFRSGERLLLSITRSKSDKREVADFGKVMTSASVQDNIVASVE
jgi:hypothetical protein